MASSHLILPPASLFCQDSSQSSPHVTPFPQNWSSGLAPPLWKELPPSCVLPRLPSNLTLTPLGSSGYWLGLPGLLRSYVFFILSTTWLSLVALPGSTLLLLSSLSGVSGIHLPLSALYMVATAWPATSRTTVCHCIYTGPHSCLEHPFLAPLHRPLFLNAQSKCPPLL